MKALLSIAGCCVLAAGLAASGIPSRAASEPMTNTSHRHRSAVIAGQLTGTADAADLSVAIGFDLEKRLERWPCLEDAERIALQRIVRETSSRGERSLVGAVMQKLDSDVVVTLGGSCKDGTIHLRVRLWTSPKSSPHFFAVSGSLAEFFAFQDELTERVVSAVRAIHPDLPAPTKADRLSLRPAESLDAYLLMIRGNIALEKGNLSEAESSLHQALEREPGLWWAHYFLGAIEFHRGHFAQAIERCKRALALDADLYPAIYANMSYCYAGLGDSAEAGRCQAEFERRTGKRLPIRGLP